MNLTELKNMDDDDLLELYGQVGDITKSIDAIPQEYDKYLFEPGDIESILETMYHTLEDLMEEIEGELKKRDLLDTYEPGDEE